MKSKKRFYYLLGACGLAILIAGLWLLKAGVADKQIAPYLCIGFGCGIFGHGVGEILGRRRGKRATETARQMAIEENDERNIAIRNRAQAKAYNVMLPVFGALFAAFGLMEVDMTVILLLVAAYLFVCGCSIYYRIKYEKDKLVFHIGKTRTPERAHVLRCINKHGRSHEFSRIPAIALDHCRKQ